MSFGTLPAASGGPSLDGTLHFRRLSLGVEGRVDLPTTIRLTSTSQITAWLAAVTFVTCARSRYVFGYLFGCGFVSMGVLASSSTGVKLTSDPFSWVAASGPRAGIELPLSEHVAAQIHGDLALRMSRTDFTIGDNRVWTSPEFAGIVGVGFVFTLSSPHRTGGDTLARVAR